MASSPVRGAPVQSQSGIAGNASPEPPREALVEGTETAARQAMAALRRLAGVDAGELAQAVTVSAESVPAASQPAPQQGAEADAPAGVPQMAPQPGDQALGLSIRPADPIGSLNAETRRWGRDDLKRGEMGSQGETLVNGVGTGLAHMKGLGDEDAGHRNGEKLVSSDNARFLGETVGVGTGVEHLWLLGDIEYARASMDPLDPSRTHEEAEYPRSSDRIVYGPLSEAANFFYAVEDTVLRGRLFDATIAGLPVSDRSIKIDPRLGRVEFRPDGMFEHTPPPGFSGVATFQFSFTDPRTGRIETGDASITVRAVVDAPTISGGATTPEDTIVATPVTVRLGDTDGSEVIERAVITGLPTGATLHWNGGLPGAISLRPDGSYVVSGSTSEIQRLLESLRVTPPADFSGRITLNVAVTITEAQVAPSLPGYRDTTTVNYRLNVDVVAVADTVTATGDVDEVTPEDVAVRLDDLAATFGDLLDGSETHTIEIRGVDPGAKLRDALGNEYPFVIAAGGTKTYTVTQGQLSDVWFLPPQDVAGTFTGMSIVVTAREPNGSTQTASAPIQVVVTPVADAVDIAVSAVATDEDTAVRFGDDITITLNDPLTEVLTRVVVSGFPVGALLTYTDVDGTPRSFTTAAGSTSVTLQGGTEAQIRTALATLTVMPPLHSDQNLSLTVTASITDSGAVSRSDSVPMTIRVNAVADAPTLSGTASGNEDAPIALPVTTALVDSDGTESFEFARFTIPAGVTFLYPSVPPNGITVSVIGNVYTFAPGTGTTNAQFAAFLATGLQVQAPLHSNSDFSVPVTVGTIESAPSQTGEVAVLRAQTSHTIPGTVLPVNDLPAISGSSSVDEDGIVGVGANIVIPALADADGSERISAIRIGSFPAGVTPTWTAAGGTSVVLAAGIYTISGPSEADIRATLASFRIDLSQAAYRNRDEDFTLKISVTTTDLDDNGNPSAVQTTALANHLVVVNAVADTPGAVGDTKTTNEDTPVLLSALAGNLTDLDGAETKTFEIRGVDPTVRLMSGSNAGTATEYSFVVAGDGTRTYSIPVGSIGSVWFHPPAHVSGTFAGMTIAAIATEHTIAGEPIADDVAVTTAPISVTITPVADLPTISGASVTDEDTAVTFGANIVIGALADTDGSERISAVSITGVPAGVVPTYTLVGGATVGFAAGVYTVSSGSEADIRATLATFALMPPANSDANIPLAIRVTTTDNGVVTTSAPVTHTITVNAVADAPTLSGVSAGLEDTNFGFPVTTGLVDADGSERFDFARVTVPAGLSLIYPGVLPNGITVSVASNVHTFSPGAVTTTAQFANFLATGLQVRGTPTHSDADYSVPVTVGTIEATLTDSGLTLLRNSSSINVPVTITAVADGVTAGGSSIVVEDVARTIGTEIGWSRIDTDGSESVTRVEVTGFPTGSTYSYVPVGGGAPVVVNVAAGGSTLVLTGGSEAQIRSALDSLALTAPLHSDTNFALSVSITTTDNDASTKVDSYSHAVTVQAVADTPSVSVAAMSGNEDTLIPLSIDAGRSPDDDGSEVLSVRITLPMDGGSLIGTIVAVTTGGFTVSGSVAGVYTITGAPTGTVTVTDQGGGVYLVHGPGAGTPADREAAIDAVLQGNVLNLQPRAQWSNVLTGASGIRVDAISTEAASGGELAPAGFGGADGTSKTETVTTYIGVTVAPVVDLPVLANANTIVQENTNSSNPSDPDLVIPLGARLGLTIADTDGSQGLSLSLTGFPTNLQAASFGTTLGGVTTNVDLATGTITLSGTNANNVLSVLSSLSITLADDRDQNFTVSVSGTATDSNGSSNASAPVSLTHSVVVQAVADTPAVDVGAATKPAVNEDSGFVGYPVTVALNDTDGSETYQSVTVDFSTPGAGARPVVQFGTTAGVTFDTTTPGRIVLTGAASDIQAAMASLQIRPGADNGENITVTVTAVAVESAPAEDNNGAGAGMGGGVVGPEISVPTATFAQTFVIPITPVPEVPVLSAPATATGLEDTRNTLGAFSISGTADPDGSEQRFLEIDTTSFPAGMTFWNGATQLTTVVGGWLRIPESALGTFTAQPPSNFTGTADLSVRVTVVDTTTTTTVTSSQAAQTVALTVNPVADPVTPPSRSIGFEDQSVTFGATLANATTGIRVTDTVVGSPTNGGSETISQVVLTVPGDTNALVYVMSGTYVPSVTGTIAGSGTAEVAYNSATRSYTITSTIITDAADPSSLSNAQRAQAETDIRATLATFQVLMEQDRDGNSVPDGHQDQNGGIAVSVTTLDVKNGVADTEVTNFTHDVAILARADTPSVTAGFVVSGAESGATANPIALVGPGGERISVNRSADTDGVADGAGWGSERLSVQVSGLPPLATVGPSIVLPAGATITGSPGGTYTINASNENDLNTVLAALTVTSPSASGPATLTITAITTEQGQAGDPDTGSGAGIDVRTATALATITLNVSPTVDTPTVKGNAVGLEDTLIPIPMSVTLGDKDGSETYVSRIIGGVPPGARIYGAGGAEILPVAGIYTLSPDDVAALAILPPLHYSSPLSGDIVLSIETTVTDTSSLGNASAIFTTTVPVEVTGVADKPNFFNVHIVGNEDEPLAIGAAIVAGAGGSLAGVLVDADMSEQLSFVVSGLPMGVVPGSAVPSGLIYLGGGAWQVTAAAITTLTLPTVPNCSGENPYAGITVRAVAQELDGSQANSDPWPVTFSINPVINAATVDGFSSWNMGATVREQQNETGALGISLSSVASHAYRDNDGSEAVTSYTFDLSGLIADAGLAGRLAALPGAGSGLDKLVANYIDGTFTYNAGAGTITILAADIAGVRLRHELFLDSNDDFSIPVSAVVRDTAIIGGMPVTTDKTENGTFYVNLIGTADTPTVFASSVSGSSGTSLALSLGGVSTDTDVGLGRALSEDIYYVVTLTNPGTAPALGFVDGSGAIVGLDNGDGTWILTPADLAGLRVITPAGSTGTANLRLTSIAVENDGDTASNSTNFTVTVSSTPGGGGTPPLPPSVTIGTNAGDEDGSITLNVTATPTPGDTSNPSVAVMISGLLPGTEVIGARFNPEPTAGWPALLPSMPATSALFRRSTTRARCRSPSRQWPRTRPCSRRARAPRPCRSRSIPSPTA